MPRLLAAPLTQFVAVRPRRTYEQIAEQITNLIQTNGLRLGERLPGERELAMHLGVSRPSLREAFIALEAAGLIQVRHGEGAFVCAPCANRTDAPWASSFSSEPSWLEQMEACRVIEPEVVALVAKIGDPDVVARLRAALVVLTTSDPTNAAGIQARYDFHLLLAESCGNKIFAAVVKELWTLRASEMWRAIRKRDLALALHVQTFQARAEMIDAVARKQPRKARQAMADLVRMTRERYL